MKKIKIIILFAGILLLTGCGKTKNDNKPNDIVTKKTDEIKEIKEESQNVDVNAEKPMGDEIKNAMSLKKPMKCTYYVNNSKYGKMFATTYMQGDKFKTDLNRGIDIDHTVFDSEYRYSWIEGKNDGLKITKECMRELNNYVPNAINDSETNITEAFEGEFFVNAMDVKCEEADSVDFAISESLTFIDGCEVLKEASKGSK